MSASQTSPAKIAAAVLAKKPKTAVRIKVEPNLLEKESGSAAAAGLAGSEPPAMLPASFPPEQRRVSLIERAVWFFQHDKVPEPSDKAYLIFHECKNNKGVYASLFKEKLAIDEERRKLPGSDEELLSALQKEDDAEKDGKIRDDAVVAIVSGEDDKVDEFVRDPDLTDEDEEDEKQQPKKKKQKTDKKDVKSDKKDVKSDKKDVKSDKKDVKSDKKDVKSDKKDVKTDEKNGGRKLSEGAGKKKKEEAKAKKSLAKPASARKAPVPTGRKRKFRPGTQALREIRRYQKSTDLLIRKEPFSRLFREVLQGFKAADGSFYRVKADAILAGQHALEDFAVERFQDAQRMAIHAKRVTVKPEDMELGNYIAFKEAPADAPFRKPGVAIN